MVCAECAKPLGPRTAYTTVGAEVYCRDCAPVPPVLTPQEALERGYEAGAVLRRNR